MREKQVITTTDINEVAKIHSDPKYINWKIEYKNGEYKFYSPNYVKSDTITFYHGGASPNFTLDDLDILKLSEKQQNSSNSYAGFYMYSEKDKESAYHYAEQENQRKNTTNKGILEIKLDSNLKMFEVPPFSITRITKDTIESLQKQGYDIIFGKMLGKTEYVLINKDKVKSMEYKSLEEKIVSVPLEQLKNVLTEEGFTIFGHGTGGNNIEVVNSIFKNGLRASHTSIFYTSIGLEVDKDLKKFKAKLDNWQHLDSENIILMKLPNQYFNILGDSMDLDCERTGAFVNQRVDEKGNITYYLDPKFILGSYNRNTGQVTINPSFEFQLTEQSIQQMTEKLSKIKEKVKRKNEGLFQQVNDLSEIYQTTTENSMPSYDYNNSEFDINSTFDSLNWDDEFPPLEEFKGKSK
jgi:hypothetical protein